MEPGTRHAIDQAIDRYTPGTELNYRLKQFAERKVEELSIWGQLSIAAHDMFGGSFPYMEDVAATSEMLMLSLDIVDDLQDGDNPTMPWMQAGQPVALNAILSLIFTSVGELARIRAEGIAAGHAIGIDLQTVSQMINQSILGQQTDVTNAVVTEQDYITMIRDKSGSLLKLAIYFGYAAAGLRDTTTIERINELAETLGVISQIRNDIRDVVRWDLKNDLLQKKRTLPVLFLLADEENPFVPLRDYYDGRISQQDFLLHKQACMNYIEQSGCLEYSSIIQSLFRDRAEELLEGLPVEDSLRERFRLLTLGPRE